MGGLHRASRRSQKAASCASPYFGESNTPQNSRGNFDQNGEAVTGRVEHSRATVVSQLQQQQ